MTALWPRIASCTEASGRNSLKEKFTQEYKKITIFCFLYNKRWMVIYTAIKILNSHDKLFKKQTNKLSDY